MKSKQSNAKIVESLENLKTELSVHSDTRSREIWFKINSCLYAQYPHSAQRKLPAASEHAVIKNVVQILSTISHLPEDDIIDLLTGHTWSEEEANDIKRI